MPFFSVISCLYNVSNFFQNGISCLLNQSFKDYEIILVDDGSTDTTGLLADRVATQHKNIRVIHQKNAGPGAARNAGIKVANGRYLCFYDMDDVVRRDWLQIIYREIVDCLPRIGVFGYREINEKYHSSVAFEFPRMLLSTNEEIGKVFPGLLSGITFNNGFVWNKVYERDFILKHNILFPDLKIQQDEVFNHRAYKHADSLLLIPEVLYEYHVYESGNNRSRFIHNRLKCFITVRDSFLHLLNYWECNDGDMINYIHSRFIFNSFFNRNPHKGLKSHKEDIAGILKTHEIEESGNILKDNNFRKHSSFTKLYLRCMRRQSLWGMFAIDCVLSLKTKAKGFIRHFR